MKTNNENSHSKASQRRKKRSSLKASTDKTPLVVVETAVLPSGEVKILVKSQSDKGHPQEIGVKSTSKSPIVVAAPENAPVVLQGGSGSRNSCMAVKAGTKPIHFQAETNAEPETKVDPETNADSMQHEHHGHRLKGFSKFKKNAKKKLKKGQHHHHHHHGESSSVDSESGSINGSEEGSVKSNASEGGGSVASDESIMDIPSSSDANDDEVGNAIHLPGKTSKTG